MKKIYKAYAVMTNKGNLIEELRKDNSFGYLIAETKNDAKKMLMEQMPPENWIINSITIMISDEILAPKIK